MPEIGEIARIVHYIRKYLVGKTLAKVVAEDDDKIYGAVGTSGAAFQKAITGRKVVGAGQQGKYFWIEMDKPPHPLIHFGMTGWLKIKGQDTVDYKRKQDKEEQEDEEEEWPPQFWRFQWETKEEPKVQAAMIDARRLGRVRLIDCAADQIRKVSPLKENGPDPVVDKDLVTVDWLLALCRRKKVPIKALLLDQANISGIGNYVGDEIMYHAKMHPEQYSNTLSDEQIKQLHESIMHICGTVVELLGESDQFPKDWLFKHRWTKGKKDAQQTLPTGEKIAFLTVGGRTSAVVPSVQKKTGPVAKEMNEAESGGEAEDKKSKARGTVIGKKRNGKGEDGNAAAASDKAPKVNGVAKDKTVKRQRKSKFKEELSAEEEPTAEPVEKNKKRKSRPEDEIEIASDRKAKAGKTEKATSKKGKVELGTSAPSSEGRRRSGRLSRG